MRGLTDEQKAYVQEHYSRETDKSIAEHLGVTSNSIRSYREVNRLLKDKNFVYEERAKSPNLHKYTKGHISYNKGKKLEEYASAEAIAKIKSTQWGKGHKPYNYIPEGTITWQKRDGKEFRYIKINGRQIPYHRYLWEKAYGKIPKGHVVLFKDGNPSNCELNNLMLLSRQEHMKMDSNVNYPAELRSLMRIYNKVSEQLKAIENEKV